jgi:hypothetical protein
MMELAARRILPATMTDKDILAPLRFFYGAAGRDLPVTFLDPAVLPERERHLLVHDGDMTSRLAQFHGAAITLDAHGSSLMGNELFRASVLRRADTLAPVEFGAIEIALSGFEGEPLRRILKAEGPLGGILVEFSIPFSSHPRGFFSIVVDDRLAELLGVPLGASLFGRCNELRHGDGSLLAEVVEILPGS